MPKYDTYILLVTGTYFLPNAIMPYKTPVAKTRLLPNTVVAEKHIIGGDRATLK